jgi:hypothetical protein
MILTDKYKKIFVRSICTNEANTSLLNLMNNYLLKTVLA